MGFQAQRNFVCASQDQLDLHTAFQNTNCEGGIDKELYLDYVNNLDAVLPTDHDRNLWMQYAAEMMFVNFFI